MVRITGLPDAQVVDWEAKLEAQVVASLQVVMDTLARRLDRIQVAAARRYALVAADENPPPQTGQLAIPAPEPLPATIPAASPNAAPGQPYVSPDDLASISPLWQQQVAEQVLPLVAQVFIDSAGHIRSQLLEHVPAHGVLQIPALGSAAAERYLREVKSTYDKVGEHLWATARAQLAEGFEAGESIEQLAARLRRSAGLAARSSVLVARTSVIEASNFGSISMARLSGLDMEKEWLCVVAGTEIAAIEPLQVVERRRTTGWLTTLRTNHGRFLTVTPNHPVLTSRGWIRAHSLHVGDNLVCYRDLKTSGVDDPAALDSGTTSFGNYPDIQHVPAQIDQVFRALTDNGARRGMVSSATDFYSDPVNCEIEVVPVDSDLTADINAALGQPAGNSIFALTDAGLGYLAATSAFDQILSRGAKSSISDLGSYTSGHPFRLHGPSFPLVAHFPGCALASDFDPSPAQESSEGSPAVAIPLTEHDERVVLDDVELDELINVEVYWAANRHNVYDLTTNRGWFVANGIVVHNSTPDLRTRPTHLAADGQRVDLNEVFQVGGFAADFPAAPNLPPSERYRCRCTVGYVFPDDQPALPSPTVDQALPGAPGTPAIEGLPDLTGRSTEGPLTQFYPKKAGPEPAPLEPIFGTNKSYVRPSLVRAGNPEELRRAWEAEASAITGRPFVVEPLPTGVSPLTAREYAEATLQMLERYPEALVTRIAWFNNPASGNYAQYQRFTHIIQINEHWASDANRRKFLAQLRSDVKGWDEGRIGWSVRGAFNPQSVIYHEFFHVLDFENLGRAVDRRVLELVERRAALEGITADDLVARDISAYAGSQTAELIAEAGADVMINGDRASMISREIVDLIDREYRARGYGIRLAPLSPEEIEETGLDLFPRAAGPRPRSAMTVAELRAEARTRGVAIPIGARKADIVRLLDETSPSAPFEAAEATAGSAAYRAAQAELRATLRRPVTLEPYRQSGSSANTFIEAHEGRKVVTKDYSRVGTKAAGVRDTDAEELGALVMDALEVPTQTVVRTGERSIAASFLEGQYPEAYGDFVYPSGIEAMVDTDPGRLLGLADVLIGNSDRRRNLVKLVDGRLASFDLGGAFRAPKLAGATDPSSPLGGYFAGTGGRGWRKANDMDPRDLALIRQRLEALRPEFERLGRAAWHRQMMARLDEIEKRATGTVRRLSGSAPDLPTSALATKGTAIPAPAPRPRVRAAAGAARMKVLDQRRQIAEALGDVDQMLHGQASARALAARARAYRGLLGDSDAGKALEPLLEAMESGEAAIAREALEAVRTKATLEVVGGDAGDVTRYRAATMRGAADEAVAEGSPVHIIRPGYSVTIRGKTTQLTKATVVRATDQELAAAEKKATRAAARARQAEIAKARGTAHLLADLDQLIARKAPRSAIRQALDPALTAPEQLYAGVEAETLRALQAALDTGDTAKLRAALTRVGKQRGISPLGRAGAKADFDPETMEIIGGGEAPAAGTKVIIERRGAQLEGLTESLQRTQVRQVTPVAEVRTASGIVPKFEMPKDIPAADLTRIKKIIGTGEDVYPWYDDFKALPYDLRDDRVVAFVERFRQRYPGVYERLTHDAQVKDAYADWRREFKVRGSAAEVRARMVEEMRSQLSDAQIVVRRRRESSLRDMLDSGRMKTQFETGSSTGTLNTDLRARFEQMMWGYARDLDPAMRPVYGYLSPMSVDGETYRMSVGQYGDIRIVLKDSVRDRTSFTVGDSLGTWKSTTSSPVKDPAWETYNFAPGSGWRAPGAPGRDYASEKFQSSVYVEAQVHGGVRVSDIAEVVFYQQPEPQTVRALKRAGVPWRVVRAR